MSTELTLGPPRYFVPVCIRYWFGYIGGPAWYQEVAEKDKNRGPIIVEGKNHDTRTNNIMA